MMGRRECGNFDLVKFSRILKRGKSVEMETGQNLSGFSLLWVELMLKFFLEVRKREEDEEVWEIGLSEIFWDHWHGGLR